MRLHPLKISIALATYNGAPYVERQLLSLANQTRRPDELIVADDNSSDESLDIVRRFVCDTGMASVILLNKSGAPFRPPQNFGRALAECSGDLVFCCDQDDEWDVEKVATVCAQLDSSPELACFLNNARFCDAQLRPSGLDKLGQIRSVGLPDESFVMGCCAAFRKSFLDIALPIPDEITHDGWLIGLCDLLKLSHRSNVILQSYRIHGGNVSTGFFINVAGRSGRIKLFLLKFIAHLSGALSNHALLRELVFISAAEERLVSKYSELSVAYPNANIERAMTQLKEQRNRLEFRKSIRQARLGKRVRMLWSGFRNGEYRGRGGGASAIKDAIVRMHPSERFQLWPR
jgi:glycosyltransferase involved in cell wall biosynthesis